MWVTTFAAHIASSSNQELTICALPRCNVKVVRLREMSLSLITAPSRPIQVEAFQDLVATVVSSRLLSSVNMQSTFTLGVLPHDNVRLVTVRAPFMPPSLLDTQVEVKDLLSLAICATCTDRLRRTLLCEFASSITAPSRILS